MRAPQILLLSLAIAVAPACAPKLTLGSDLLWEARHETGDLSEWSGDGTKGGFTADTPDTSIAVSTDQAHSGKYSVKLSNAAVSSYEEVRLFRLDAYPQAAYYSVWYYVPRAYQTTNDWVILQLRSPSPLDAGAISLLMDVDLRSLPGGQLILSVYDHRGQYLRAATPDPAVPVPIGRWFQVQVFFDYSSGSDGRFALWQDGQLLYDLSRPYAVDDMVYFSPCSVSQALSPTDSTIYVDDAAVSLTPLRPDAPL